MLKNVFLLGLIFMVSSSSIASHKSVDVLINYTNTSLTPERFEPGFYEKFEQAIAQRIRKECPGSTYDAVTVLDARSLDLLVEWVDFFILDKKGNLLFRAETRFADGSYGLSGVEILYFQTIGCQ